MNIHREIFVRRAFNWSPEPVKRLAKALEGLDLFGACAIAVRLHELLGPYSLGELEKEILKVKGAVKPSWKMPI